MGRNLRILHTADSHIGAALPARPRRSFPHRGEDFIASYRTTVGRALDLGAELLIHGGDLFNRSTPHSRALMVAAEPLLEAAANGVTVIIIPGNHERSVLPDALLLCHPRIHIIREPTTLRLRLCGINVSISAIPCLRRNAEQDFPEALERTGWRTAGAEVNILAVHQTFDSAVCGPAGYRFRAGPDVVPRAAIPSSFHYVAAGHIHRHQTLERMPDDGPPIVYSGSPDRISFAEADEPKGCVLLEAQGAARLSYQFVEHRVRPMAICPLNVTGLTRKQIIGRIEALIQSLPPAAVAQVRLAGKASADALRNLSFAKLARRLRPDALVTCVARDLEWDRPSRGRVRHGRNGNTHAGMEGTWTDRVDTTALPSLPTCRGVYALYDDGQRLLYIGKATNLRARVRTHVRGRNGSGSHAGWTSQIQSVATSPANSDLEALLREADLIRRHRPPFNRQMRRWTGYCYLTEDESPNRELRITRHAGPADRCFGPFRTRHFAEAVREAAAICFRTALCPEDEPTPTAPLLFPDAAAVSLCNRYYNKLCSGPCADRLTADAYNAAVEQRNQLLSGQDDGPLIAIEGEEGDVDARHLHILQEAFRHLTTLRQAEDLLGGAIILPSDTGSKLAFVDVTGIDIRNVPREPAEARRCLAAHSSRARTLSRTPRRRLPVTVLDSFCIAARQVDQHPHDYRLICANELATRDPADLLQLLAD